MARLTILAAVGVLLAVLFVVKAHRTTITTVEIESENPGPYQRCEDQIRRQNLRECAQYIRQGQDQYGVLEMNSNSREQERQLQQCCNQLSQIDQQCQCEAMKHIMRQQRQQGQQLRGEQLQRAQNLPSLCGSGRQCDVRVE